jgi:hypothetical protein
LAAGTEPAVEVLEGLLEADLGGIELAHGEGQAVLGEVARRDAAHPRDELHRALRRLVVAVGEHVDVGVGDALVVELARGLGQRAVAEPARLHEGAQGISEWLIAGCSHGLASCLTSAS